MIFYCAQIKQLEGDMWKIRLQEKQHVDDSRDHQQQQQQARRLPAQVCEVRRQDRVVNGRRMSLGDTRTDRRRLIEAPRLFDSLPRLFSRLVASFSRSLAFLAPPPTSTDGLSYSSSEPHHISLEDEVD